MLLFIDFVTLNMKIAMEGLDWAQFKKKIIMLHVPYTLHP
jgi:hypothetical protein